MIATRWTVYVANRGFVSAGSHPTYNPRGTHYNTDPSPQAARVFFQRKDADRVAKATGGCVTGVVLWYGPYAPSGEVTSA